VAALAGIGVDWCDDNNLGNVLELADQVLAQSEYGNFARAPDPARHLQRVFCAKEAVVKAASASVARFVELSEIAIHGDSDAFVARISGHSLLIRGTHISVQTHALAWAVLPA
jgi:4'-phosphopantetheinyl transferase EntD